jgi:hypothetical protein
MSSLTAVEKNKLEKLFGMHTGYVLNFSNRTFENFFADFEIEIYSEKYDYGGASKASLLRAFWKLEADHLVGQVISGMIETGAFSEVEGQLVNSCKEISQRLLSGKLNLSDIKSTIASFNLQYIENQIRRIENSVTSDPDLAIGTSKELIESCCKTILTERSVNFEDKNDDLPKLVKLTLKELNLVPESIQDSAKGSDTIKRILSNLSSVLQGIGELRNKYGTGHGKEGNSKGLTPRHARLVAGTTATIVHFIFETHLERAK